MFVEIHLLQNFALSNLNRDDTGAPKSCIFGGVRRARISSQCQKRAIRTYMREEKLIPSEDLSRRTRKVVREVVQRLINRGLSMETAQVTADKAMNALELKIKQGKTEYLLMLGEREIERLVDLCFMAAEGRVKEKELAGQLLAALDGGDAIDLALFGRMVASHASKNVDAAVQMAHAFSTHPVANEFDYFTAIDDLQDDEDEEGAGAAMLGTILYNSSCYYRYANLDLNQLTANLHGDRDKAIFAAQAFLEGMIKAVPSGKQNNSAAQNPPSLIMVVIRRKGLWSLANAFAKAIRVGNNDLLASSASQLLHYWQQLVSIYGLDGIEYVGLSTYLPLAEVEQTTISLEPSFPDLQQRVLRVLRSSQD